MERAHRQHSAAPLAASKGNLSERVVLAWRVLDEGEKM